VAEFCQQCSTEIFGEDSGDFSHPDAPPLGPNEGWVHLCEGCGPIYTDNDGKCICDCDKHHHVENSNADSQ
jgi:hypothetical protein